MSYFCSGVDLVELLKTNKTDLRKKAIEKKVPYIKKGNYYYYYSDFESMQEQQQKIMGSGCKVISFGNHKGGVYKTTTANNVATMLAFLNYKVLLVELDIQCNLTELYGKANNNNSIIAKLKDDKNIDVCNIELDIFKYGKLDFIPNDISIYKNYANFDYKDLDRVLNNYKKEYDIIILDTPPNLMDTTPQALKVSDYVLMTLKPDYFSYSGAINFIELIEECEANLIGGVITGNNKKNIADQVYIEQIENKFLEIGSKICNTKISTSAIYNDTSLEGKYSILELSPKHKAVSENFDVTRFLLDRIEKDL